MGIGIRSTLASILGGDEVESRVRQTVEEVLATKGFATPADMQELRDRVGAGGEGTGTEAARVEALEETVAELRKKLNMAMNAVQAATAQLADARRAADEAKAEAKRAYARAESALASVESLSDGVEALERAGDTVNLNSADAKEFETLSGIGPSMAIRIVEDRDANGPFGTVAELARVRGLGSSIVNKLAGQLSV